MSVNVIIMRGIPGSGKSTFVKKNYNPAYICSADSYHTVDGVYQWKPENVRKAHGTCLRKFSDGLRTSQPLIIVDNTNIHAWEISPYYALADAYGANVKIISFKIGVSALTVRDALERIGQRNVHDVPMATVERMALALDKEQLPRHWNIEHIHPIFEDV